MRFKVILFLFLFPVFAFSEINVYVQPEVALGKYVGKPRVGAGLGFRFHSNKHGFDASANVLPLSYCCSSNSHLPFLRAAYLFYPCQRGGYVGMGADVGFILGPLATIGYEFQHTGELFSFFQVDGCYSIIGPQVLGVLSFGFGF